jgi:hypothetical protein
VLTVALLVVLAVVGYAIYEISIASRTVDVPPHVVAVLSNGSTLFEVPLMTMYTAPSLAIRGFTTNVSLHFESRAEGPSSNFTFRWQNVSGTSEDVRFVLDSVGRNSSFQPIAAGPEDGFVYFPAGICSAPCDHTGWSTGMSGNELEYLLSDLWVMNYTVSRMAATVSSVEQKWVQVNYSLAWWGGLGNSLPTGNVTPPSAADLLALGGNTTIGYTRGSSSFTPSLAGSMIPSNMSFQHSLPPVRIREGAAGNLTAVLAVRSGWNSATQYWLGWGFGPANGGGMITYRYYVDVRFGSILVQFGS